MTGSNCVSCELGRFGLAAVFVSEFVGQIWCWVSGEENKHLAMESAREEPKSN